MDDLEERAAKMPWLSRDDPSAYSGLDHFRRAVIRTQWLATELPKGEAVLEQIKTALRAAGYEKFWVNTAHPHCSGLQGYTHLVAWPRKEPKGSSRLWNALSKAGIRYGCGNGLREADQAQLDINVAKFIPPGEYDLTKED